jgi:antitoxin (DNA-binding transcriptional repressor) of toxin-antitoxin stability system
LERIMIVVTAVEAQNRFGDLIDQAQREPIEITRRGRPVAYVVCEHAHKALQDVNTRREKAMSWYANYRRTTVTSPEAAALTDADIDQLVHELR